MSDYPERKDLPFLLSGWQSYPIQFEQGAVYVALSAHLASQGVLGYGVYAARDLIPPPPS